jgi:hypothetical protein
MAQEADEQKPRWMEQLEEKQRAKAEAEAEAGLPVDSQDALQPEEGDPVEFADEPGTDPPINGPGAGIDAPIDAPVAQPPTETPVADGGDWLAEEAAPPFEPPRTSVEPPAVPPPPGLTPRTITPAVPPPPGLTPRTITPAAPPPAVPGPLGTETSVLEELEEVGIGRLRDDAIRYGRADADAGVPGVDSEGQPESERDLVERCRGFYDRWKATERRHRNAQVAEREQAISEKLGLGGLAVDKYERLTNELLRLKARLSVRRQEVASELDSIDDGPTRGLSTRVYAAAIGFLGVVEFFANAPVFTALLPRDPLTERQIRLVAETSEGWMAGAQRVFAHLILRPDAALLAAGVVTFLCVLAHFFGHSLRAAVQQRDQEERHHVSGRTQIENIIPMILSGVGLILVLGVLYEARVTLGEVGEQQYTAGEPGGRHGGGRDGPAGIRELHEPPELPDPPPQHYTGAVRHFRCLLSPQRSTSGALQREPLRPGAFRLHRGGRIDSTGGGELPFKRYARHSPTPEPEHDARGRGTAECHQAAGVRDRPVPGGERTGEGRGSEDDPGVPGSGSPWDRGGSWCGSGCAAPTESERI